MKSFDNFKQIEQYIKKQAKEALDRKAKDIYEEMREFIVKNLYNAYSPKKYVTSYEFIDSLTIGNAKETKNGISVDIYFDTDKIKQTEMVGSMNQHMSVTGDTHWHGEKISAWLPTFLDEGTPNSTVFKHKGIHLMDYITSDPVTKRMVKDIVRFLESKGLDCNFI